MPPPFVFTTHRLGRSFGGKVVFEGISLAFYYGAKIGIVGENGSGKTTLLRIMAGLDEEYDGEAELAKGMRVGYVAQEPVLDLQSTVRENLRRAVAPIQALIDRFEEISARLAEPIEPEEMERLLAEMGRLQEGIDACGGWEIERWMDIASDALVLPPDDMPVRLLSGGERRRVALCKALLERPDLLLLDEPTNHLDPETVAWLETALREYPGTVIIVTHDRYFLDNVTSWILELDDGRGIPFEGNYSSWLAQKAERLRIAEKRESERQRTLARELEWIQRLAKGGGQRNQARIARFDELARRAPPDARSDALIPIAPGPPLGEKVLRFQGVTKGFDGVNLLEDCSFELPRGAIVGLVGPNGSGKTTLLRLIAGEERPDAGTIELGPSVVLSYVDQHRDALDATKTVFEEITGGADAIELGDVSIPSRAYVARFNFRGSQQQKRVGDLSGGERNRVHLAKLLRRGGNLLLLDEPTNDLDVNTMRVLEQALLEFPGCALVVSHDRFFLDRVSTHLLVFEGGGRVRWFEGNFRAYEEFVRARDPDRLVHRRAKYRRLSPLRA